MKKFLTLCLASLLAVGSLSAQAPCATTAMHWVKRDLHLKTAADSTHIVVTRDSVKNICPIGHDTVVTPPDTIPHGGGFPHEPAGLQQIAHTVFNTLPGARINTDNPWIFNRWANAWSAGAGAIRLTYPVGMDAGNGPGIMQIWKDGSEINSPAYDEVYESIWLKIGDGNGFETQAYLVKFLGYWGYGDRGKTVPNQLIGLGSHSPPTGVATSWPFDFIQQGWEDRRFTSGVSLVSGKWMHIEVHFKMNAMGQKNGILQAWVDGKMSHNFSDVEYRTAAHPSGFYGHRFDPIWGGRDRPGEEANKKRVDYLYLDDIYISAR